MITDAAPDLLAAMPQSRGKAPKLAELATAESVLQANIGKLHHTATQVSAVLAVEWVILNATKQQAGWGRLKLIALCELGLFLLRTPRQKQGRPAKMSTADILPLKLTDLGITDRRIASRAIAVARIDRAVFEAYLATADEPTEKGLHRDVAERSSGENYSDSENVVPFSTATLAGRGAYGVASNGTEEWYVPRPVFQALGCRFDLDVASPGPAVVPWIPADHHFTIADNGLEQDWGDKYVWCNPPFGKEILPQWLEKFRRHGNGICLIGDRTSVGWWQDVCGHADLILLVNKKINFISPTIGATGNNTLGSTLVAYGKRAVNALMNAARQGLGTLFKPCPVPISHAEAEEPDVAERCFAGDRITRGKG
jgi:DNA N-6-adenine-methyltransferase (Dam)